MHTTTINQLLLEMIAYFTGDPKRISHFLKVHSFARLIGESEHLSPEELYILELAAIVHDIGIRSAEEKYHKSSGKLQEQEGPSVARTMLLHLDVAPEVIDRVCYLVGHHHTYTHIDGMDYQILVEADFLVNLYEDNSSPAAVTAACEKIFKTPTGRQLCLTIYD